MNHFENNCKYQHFKHIFPVTQNLYFWKLTFLRTHNQEVTYLSQNYTSQGKIGSDMKNTGYTNSGIL